jgi:hypothetical protein
MNSGKKCGPLPKKERTSPKWCKQCNGKLHRRGKRHDIVLHGAPED